MNKGQMIVIIVLSTLMLASCGKTDSNTSCRGEHHCYESGQTNEKPKQIDCGTDSFGKPLKVKTWKQCAEIREVEIGNLRRAIKAYKKKHRRFQETSTEVKRAISWKTSTVRESFRYWQRRHFENAELAPSLKKILCVRISLQASMDTKPELTEQELKELNCDD